MQVFNGKFNEVNLSTPVKNYNWISWIPLKGDNRNEEDISEGDISENYIKRHLIMDEDFTSN